MTKPNTQQDAPTTMKEDLDAVKAAMQAGTTDELIVGGPGDPITPTDEGAGDQPTQDGATKDPGERRMPKEGEALPKDSGTGTDDDKTTTIQTTTTTDEEDPRDAQIRQLEERLAVTQRTAEELAAKHRDLADKEVKVQQANKIREINAKAMEAIGKLAADDPELQRKELQILLDAQAEVTEALIETRAEVTARRVLEETKTSTQREDDNTKFVKAALRKSGFAAFEEQDLNDAVELFFFELGRHNGPFYAVPEAQRKMLTNQQIADLIIPVVQRRWGLSTERIASIQKEREQAQRAGRPIGRGGGDGPARRGAGPAVESPGSLSDDIRQHQDALHKVGAR